MIDDRLVVMLVPALDEGASLPGVLASIDRTLVDHVVVCDNGSTDDTAEAARAGGAIVVREARRGYGSACQRAALAAEAKRADVLVFMDADGSDDPGDLRSLLDPLVRGADLVIGSRVRGGADPGALAPVQRFGNRVACALIRGFWGVAYTDLGPFRAIQRAAYDGLAMSDPDFGWTVEMQVKAAQRGLRVVEIPVRYRARRLGRSKVSGNLVGSWRAGQRILRYVLAAKLADLRRDRRS